MATTRQMLIDERNAQRELVAERRKKYEELSREAEQANRRSMSAYEAHQDSIKQLNKLNSALDVLGWNDVEDFS